VSQAEVEHRILRETYQNVRKSFVDGVPLHRLASARDIEPTKGCSSIFVVEWSKFKTMSTQEIQRVFSQRHILVLNAPVETVNFDREGLETLGSMTTTREVQGKGILNHTTSLVDHKYVVGELRVVEGKSSKMNQPGTLEDLYQASLDPESQRVWNYLDHAMGHLSQEPLPRFK
jgi:hypothetical protein